MVRVLDAGAGQSLRVTWVGLPSGMLPRDGIPLRDWERPSLTSCWRWRRRGLRTPNGNADGWGVDEEVNATHAAVTNTYLGYFDHVLVNGNT